VLRLAGKLDEAKCATAEAIALFARKGDAVSARRAASHATSLPGEPRH